MGLRADTTLISKAHDRSRRNGEWRFFPYLTDDSSWGNFKLGYVYNAAYQLHRGARDITFLGVEATNLVYFLSNPNWANKTKSVKFATPKSVAMINDGRAPKLSYITPWLGNTKFGFSYTPDNAHRRGMVSRYTDYEKTMDGYVWAMQNKWQLSSSVLYTSAGYGIFNRTDKEASVGVRWQKGSFNLGAGYKKAYVDGKENAIATARVNAFLPAYLITTVSLKYGILAWVMISGATKPMLPIFSQKRPIPVIAMFSTFGLTPIAFQKILIS